MPELGSSNPPITNSVPLRGPNDVSAAAASRLLLRRVLAHTGCCGLRNGSTQPLSLTSTPR